MAPTQAAAAGSSAGPTPRAAISARASASRLSAATTRCGWHSTGPCSGYGRRAASPICGCAISRSVRFDIQRARPCESEDPALLGKNWIPACAGMSGKDLGRLAQLLLDEDEAV